MRQTLYQRESADQRLKSAVSEARKLCAGAAPGGGGSGTGGSEFQDAALAKLLDW